MNKQYRYSNYVNSRVICESDWLLQASNSQGQIYDNLRKKFIEPHPYPFLIEDAFNIKWLGQPLSVTLAMEESSGLLAIELDEGNILHSLCLNPEVNVMFFKKKKIDKETGEVEELDFDSRTEKAIHLHTRYLKEVAYLTGEKARAVAECDDPDELGVLPESLQEAKSRLLGHSANKRSWRDFL